VISAIGKLHDDAIRELSGFASGGQVRQAVKLYPSYFGHSFGRTECERTFANVAKIAEYSRPVCDLAGAGFESEVRYIALPTTENAFFCYWRGVA
jgi:hypothetical protein